MISGIIFTVLFQGEAWSKERFHDGNAAGLISLRGNPLIGISPIRQQIEVKGKVTDAKGAAIPGVSVKIKNTTTATVTDANGEFRIRTADKNVTLTFSYTGFVTQEKDLGSGTVLTIVLIEDNKNLTEVVVVGYGQQRKATVTGSIARANLESFRDAPNTNIGQSLQGAVAGLNVGPVTAAGNTPTIRVRGQNTLGCGDRGKGIIGMMEQFPQKFKVVAICDVLDLRLTEAHKFVKNGDYKSYKDHRQLLDDHQVDAVVVAVPLNMHYPIAVDVLDAGKHLYLEKTMTYNIEQALDLVKLVKSRPKQIVQVGHQYRYSPLYFKVKDMISKGYLGEISQVDCRWDRNANWRRPVPDVSLERQINWRCIKNIPAA